MQLFLSWSGTRSRAVAECLKDWIPLMLQSVTPWFSPEDIDKGARWLSDLSLQLQQQSFAIICVTPENLSAPWLLFEAGALSKAIDASRVCPLLLGVEPANVQGPLAQFQATRIVKGDIRKLVETINKCQATPLPDSKFDTLFDLLWPRLEAAVASVPLHSDRTAHHRPVPDLLAEVLDRIRAVERQITVLSPVPPEATFARTKKQRWMTSRDLSSVRQSQKALILATKSVIDHLGSVSDPQLLQAIESAQQLVHQYESQQKRERDAFASLLAAPKLPGGQESTS